MPIPYNTCVAMTGHAADATQVLITDLYPWGALGQLWRLTMPIPHTTGLHHRPVSLGAI